MRYYIGVQTRRHFSQVFGDLARYLAEGSKSAYPQTPPALDDAATARLEVAQASLTEAGYSPAIASHLTGTSGRRPTTTATASNPTPSPTGGE